jgi:hypothetical protein
MLNDSGRVVARFKTAGGLDQIAEGKREASRATGGARDGQYQEEHHRSGQQSRARAGQTQGAQDLRDEDQRADDDQGEYEEDADGEADEEMPSHAVPRKLALWRPRLVGRPPAGPIAVWASP